MAWTQIGTSTGTGLSRQIVVGAAGVPAGVVIFVAWAQRGATNSGNLSISDSVNGAYSIDAGNTSSFNRSAALAVFVNNSALVENDTIDASWTQTTPEASNMIAFYTDEVSLTSPLDQGIVGATENTATPNSGNITTTVAASFAIGVLMHDDADATTETQDANFTTATFGPVSQGQAAGDNSTCFVGVRELTATGTYSYAPTLSEAANCRTIIANYAKAAGAAAFKPRMALMGVG